MGRSIAWALLLSLLTACGEGVDLAQVTRDPADRPSRADDPRTTNDESNDQDLGYYGTRTLCVTNHGSGNSYPLDADMDGQAVATIYFRRGGNVDFSDCELDEDFEGDCSDDEGRGWSFQGEC